MVSRRLLSTVNVIHDLCSEEPCNLRKDQGERHEAGGFYSASLKMDGI